MIIKRKHKESGKVLKTTKSLLLDPMAGYIKPKMGFLTSTTIWPVDEFIKRRVRDWRRLTLETGHSGTRTGKFRKDHNSFYTGTYSVFPIPLMEWILIRFAENGGRVLDAFAGGPPRAVASSIMGYEYVGVDVRQEQIDENLEVIEALGLKGIEYVLSDARTLKGVEGKFDIAVTCPPYFNLEVYSDQVDDISTFRTYWEFNAAMSMCAWAHRLLMKPGSFVCIVVNNIRDKNKELIDFRSHTVQNFREAGFLFHQEVILSKNFASAAKRASNAWKGKKLVPRHEYLLIFRTPEQDPQYGEER